MIQQPSPSVTRKRDEVSKELLIINLATNHPLMVTGPFALSTSCGFAAQVREPGPPRVFAEDPSMFQWRGQLGYATIACNELGVWGTWRGKGDTRLVPGFGPTAWRPINQFNVYWHHKWEPGGPDSWIWVGVPEDDRLTGAGSLGDYLVGLRANCPLSDGVSLYAMVTYMHPSASAGPAAAREEAWSFLIGLELFPARNARTNSLAGQSWMPQLPVASNGYFLVDASRTY